MSVFVPLEVIYFANLVVRHYEVQRNRFLKDQPQDQSRGRDFYISPRTQARAMDLLRATLPVGTLSGAPKVRAMEIIDELEPEKRGIFGGAVGYLSWNGNMDTAIAIRTAIIRDNQLFVQAGAGVVADSVPSLEWKETMNKARSIFQASAMAEAGLDLQGVAKENQRTYTEPASRAEIINSKCLTASEK